MLASVMLNWGWIEIQHGSGRSRNPAGGLQMAMGSSGAWGDGLRPVALMTSRVRAIAA